MKKLLSLIGAVSLGALSLINGGCKKVTEYNIDGKTIIDCREKSKLYKKANNNDLGVYGERWYIRNPIITKVDAALGKPYDLRNKTHEDSVVINEAQKKVDYFLNKIDSIEKSEAKEYARIWHERDSTNKANRLQKGLDALK